MRAQGQAPPALHGARGRRAAPARGCEHRRFGAGDISRGRGVRARRRQGHRGAGDCGRSPGRPQGDRRRSFPAGRRAPRRRLCASQPADTAAPGGAGGVAGDADEPRVVCRRRHRGGRGNARERRSRSAALGVHPARCEARRFGTRRFGARPFAWQRRHGRSRLSAGARPRGRRRPSCARLRSRCLPCFAGRSAGRSRRRCPAAGRGRPRHRSGSVCGSRKPRRPQRQ
mmetsp:Transcript_119969/g.346608  ORF Transcript_119969/g.346608 Transcript_119969/m.346608 type:complete len:228 (+) Transcript_119969:139-822(+)